MAQMKIPAEERRLWVLNDEHLYKLWQESGTPIQKFCDYINSHIRGVLDGTVASHSCVAIYTIYKPRGIS